jgi:hypothetical protein
MLDVPVSPKLYKLLTPTLNLRIEWLKLNIICEETNIVLGEITPLMLSQTLNQRLLTERPD